MAAVILGLVLAGCASSGATSPVPTTAHGPAPVPPWKPAPGTDPHWRQWFNDQMSSLKGAHPQTVFIGDSVTFAWSTTGASSWSRFARYRPANLGVPGDTTQNVLWRLDHGELASLRPGATVILIGTNNLGRWAARDVVAGIEAVVTSTSSLLPGTHVVLLGVPPIDPPGTARHLEVAEVDGALAEHYRNGPVTYLDLRSVFADPDGQLRPALYHSVCVAGTTFCDQLVHPSAQGYMALTTVVEPVLTQMLG